MSALPISQQPQSLLARPDLEFHRQVYQNNPFWLVKDPISLEYQRLCREEFFILNLLDGSNSLQDIKEAFEREFAPRRIDVHYLQQFLGSLHQKGLVTATTAGQGYKLRHRCEKKWWYKVRAMLANPLAIKWRGFDPGGLIDKMLPYTRWGFHRFSVVGVIVFAIAALILVLMNWSTFQSKLPSFHQFFSTSNWIYLGISLAIVKILHEFGHGISCHKFGARSHELGFMLLVLTPALYCNTTDSWRLKSKWQRAAIGAAGIYVELFLAALATFVWWYSVPGTVNQLALSTMFVCSVNTILFNGNPLLKFDGYYVLADLIEVPNLKTRSSNMVLGWIQRVMLGIKVDTDPYAPKKWRWLVVLYAIAAPLYRVFIVFSIMVFLTNVLEPYGLQFVGWIIGTWGIVLMIVSPLWKTFRYLQVPGRRQQMKMKTATMMFGAAAIALLAIFFVPLPCYVMAPFTVVPREGINIYVDGTGTLESILVEPDQHVNAGDPIALLRETANELEYVSIASRLNELNVAHQLVEQSSYSRPREAVQRLELLESIKSTSDQLSKQCQNMERLIVRAPASGKLIPAGHIPENAMPNALPTLSGWPLQQDNIGARLDVGQLVGQISPSDQVEIIVAIDQRDIELVENGQSVRLQLEPLIGTTYHGRVNELGRWQMEYSPPELSQHAGGDLETQLDKNGNQTPLNTTYQARVSIPHALPVTQTGYRGRAKIHIGNRSIAWRMYRYMHRTFRLKL
jgi:putative peptide zinc metalloprotease protein